MIPIPDQNKRQWVQTNQSDVMGNLFATFGVDLTSNIGKVRSGDLLYLVTNSTDQSNLGVPIGFKAFNASGVPTIFTVAGSRVFKTTVSYPSGAFIEVSGTPTDCSSDYSDIEVFNDVLYVTTTSKTVRTLSTSSAWSSFSAQATGTDNNNPHMLCTYADRMYMTYSGNSIVSWDTSNTVATLGSSNTITLNGADNISTYITFIRASSNRIWIGTLNQTGGKGYVYEWDGSSSQASRSYRLDSSGALACIIKDDIPYIMNTNGVMQVWNGGTFKNLDDANIGVSAEFNRLHNDLLFNPLNTTNDRFIHPNGITLASGKIIMLINSRSFNNASTTETTIPAGIYEYSPTNGLYHKYAASYVRSTDTFPYTDSGQVKIARAGAIAEMNLPSTASVRNGTFLCGAQYYTDATNTKYGIWYDDSQKTATSPGYFITTKQYSPNVTEMWQKVFVLYRNFYDDSEKIVVKYRTEDNDPVEGSITWISTTSFYTASNISAYDVGDEVQIIQGVGSGKPSSIVSKQPASGGNTIVTVDETYTGATGTSIAWFDHWTKIKSITESTSSFKEIGIGKAATWIQFKVWFEFQKFDEVESLLIANVPQQKVQ
jgi:hypothetical protein